MIGAATGAAVGAGGGYLWWERMQGEEQAVAAGQAAPAALPADVVTVVFIMSGQSARGAGVCVHGWGTRGAPTSTAPAPHGTR